jgi:DNA polymerase elongation subunit (family B)
MQTKKGPRILIMDIEASNLDADFGSVYCIGYKWLGEKQIKCPGIWDYPTFTTDITNDKQLIADFIPVLEEADAVVTHYGALKSRRFDLPFLAARMAFHGLATMPPFISIDTFDIAKTNFKLSSRRLGAISELLHCDTQKYHRPRQMWRDILNRNRKSEKAMAKYCMNDVLTLEAVYMRLRPYVKTIPQYHLFGMEDSMICPCCGSFKVQKNGRRVTRSRVYTRYRCVSCGSSSRQDARGKLVTA